MLIFLTYHDLVDLCPFVAIYYFDDISLIARQYHFFAEGSSPTIPFYHQQ